MLVYTSQDGSEVASALVAGGGTRQLVPQELTPGGGGVPFEMLFVDPNTGIAPGDQNGQANTPFASINDAIAARGESTTVWVELVSNNNPDVSIPAGVQLYVEAARGAGVLFIGDVDMADGAALFARDIQVNLLNVVGDGCVVKLDGRFIVGNVTGLGSLVELEFNGIEQQDVRSFGGGRESAVTGSINLPNSTAPQYLQGMYLGGDMTCLGAAGIQGCWLDGGHITATAGLSLRDVECSTGTELESPNGWRLINTTFLGACTLTNGDPGEAGNVRVDPTTLASVKSSGSTWAFPDGLEQLVPWFTVPVVVPAAGAAGLQDVDVDVSLAGMTGVRSTDALWVNGVSNDGTLVAVAARWAVAPNTVTFTILNMAATGGGTVSAYVRWIQG